MDKFKIGFIGMGRRGDYWLHGCILAREDVSLRWICDIDSEKLEAASAKIAAKGFNPKATTDYHDILKDSDTDAVIISTDWESHIPIAIECMKAGMPVGLEVGGAYSVNDCFRLVHTWEETGTFFMMLENCCYGRTEMMLLNMARQNLFGDIVHCSGGYCHDLRNSLARGRELKHYRLRNYLNRNCDTYPTHALIPIFKLLDINNGNRMVSLYSAASPAKGLMHYSKETGFGTEDILPYGAVHGDVVTTIIKCAHGETIHLNLETTLPRFYSRDLSVHGTKGIFTENGDSFYFDNIPEHHKSEAHKDFYGNIESFYEEYDHPLWKKTLKEGLSGGHGGMDGLVLSAFAQSVKNGWESPVDVYDAASAMCITALSDESIATGMPVVIPDFTNGIWLCRKEKEKTLYSL
ncbi:MAG: Gfo/Idh/MocA family oxidoreductase [Clostridia bacterium]|nr:Gfo/Idh/MocA family oxidoreductase [Clostridia bacterium]